MNKKAFKSINHKAIMAPYFVNEIKAPISQSKKNKKKKIKPIKDIDIRRKRRLSELKEWERYNNLLLKIGVDKITIKMIIVRMSVGTKWEDAFQTMLTKRNKYLFTKLKYQCNSNFNIEYMEKLFHRG